MRKVACFFKSGKSSLGVSPGDVPSAVQLWSEMEYNDSMKQVMLVFISELKSRVTH